MQALAAELWPLFAGGVVKPLSGKVFPIDAVNDAVAASQEVARGGKVLLSF